MRSKQETVFSSYSLSLNQLLILCSSYQRVIDKSVSLFIVLLRYIYTFYLLFSLGVLNAKFQVPLSKFKFPPKAYLRLESVFNVLFFIWYGVIDSIDIRNAK